MSEADSAPLVELDDAGRWRVPDVRTTPSAKRPRREGDHDDSNTDPPGRDSKRPRFFLQGAPDRGLQGARQLTLLFEWAVNAANEIEAYAYGPECPASTLRFTRRLDSLKKLYDLQEETIDRLIKYAQNTRCSVMDD